jgi:hypothetical protein
MAVIRRLKMASRAELLSELAELKCRIRDIEDELASDPEFFKEVLPSYWQGEEAVINYLKENLVKLEQTCGWFDFEKNAMDYDAYSFQLKDYDKVWEVRYGSNWCSSIAELAEEDQDPGTGLELDYTVLDESGTNGDTEKLLRYLVSEFTDEDGTDVISVIGYILYAVLLG